MRSKILFELAEEKKLPLHQFMDTETIKWIETNEPEFGGVRKLKLPDRKILESFTPSNSWFLEKKEIDSIHGLRHVLRFSKLSNRAINHIFCNICNKVI